MSARTYFLVGLAVLTSHTAYAEEFRSESGWVFPKMVGDFQRIGNPEGIAGVRDSVAQYEHSANGNRSTATVYVYPPDSRAEDASLAGAKAAIVANLKSVPLAQSWSEGPFRAGTAPVLVGEKAFYKIGIGPESSQTNLYYFDTGKWVVKIRMSVQKTEKGSFQALDSFVRDQPWDSLGLTPETCTGSACRADRAVAIHGMLPEQLAILVLDAKLKDVFPREMPACEASALESALSAERQLQTDGLPPPIAIAAACAPGKGLRASFLRVVLSPEDYDMLEKRSPDGLSLRGPITFVVMSNGKDSIYTQMHDGRFDAASVAHMLQVLGGTKHLVFAKGDKHGKNAKPVSRFIADME